MDRKCKKYGIVDNWWGLVQKMNEVQEFIGVPKMRLESHQVKIHKGSLANHITNWDDVNAALNGTKYHRFLNSDY